MKSFVATSALLTATFVSADGNGWGEWSGSSTTAAPAWPTATAVQSWSSWGGYSKETDTVTVTDTVTITTTVSSNNYNSWNNWQSTTSSSAAAATYSITAGAAGKLRFEPEFINGVNAGDVIHIDFLALNHTFTSSTFEKPCTKPADASVDTNFHNFNPNNITNFAPFDFIVPNSGPQYFYCKQANHSPKSHCGNGMVFALNVGSNDTFTQFVANAAIDGFAPAPSAPAKRSVQFSS